MFQVLFVLSNSRLRVLQQLSKYLPFNQELPYVTGQETINFNMLFKHTTIPIRHLCANFKRWFAFYLLLIWSYLPSMISSLCLLGIKRIEMPHIKSQIYFSELIRVVSWKSSMTPWITVNKNLQNIMMGSLGL